MTSSSAGAEHPTHALPEVSDPRVQEVRRRLQQMQTDPAASGLPLSLLQPLAEWAQPAVAQRAAALLDELVHAAEDDLAREAKAAAERAANPGRRRRNQEDDA